MKKTKFIDIIKYYILVFMFISVVGFFYEEILFLFKTGHLVKRGYLYGTWLPIYGIGSIIILVTCKRLEKHPVWIFLLTFISTGILEFLTGYFLWHVGHKRLWNYKGEFLNIGGYICLKSLTGFAIGGLILIYILHPLFKKIYNKLNDKQINLLVILLLIVFVIDNIFSLIIN